VEYGGEVRSQILSGLINTDSLVLLWQ
jgi:hypothetical protein